jgi:formiminotetrahydrofolate cyclodeaminase
MDEPLTDLTVRRFTERLATSDPVPGGGSAAALAGAMGAALVRMVVELSTGRPGAEGRDADLAEIGAAAGAAQSELLALAERDAAAYDAVVHARRLPRASDDDRRARDARLAAAVREATRVPLETARISARVFGLAELLAPIGNRNAISDVGVAALLASTALRGAALNVEINLPYLAREETLRDDAARTVASLLATIEARERSVRIAVAERIG